MSPCVRASAIGPEANEARPRTASGARVNPWRPQLPAAVNRELRPWTAYTPPAPLAASQCQIHVVQSCVLSGHPRRCHTAKLTECDRLLQVIQGRRMGNSITVHEHLRKASAIDERIGGQRFYG